MLLVLGVCKQSSTRGSNKAPNQKLSVAVCRALLEEALQLERQLHIALLADRLEQQDEGKEQQQQQQRRKPAGDAGDGREGEGDEAEQQQTEAEADAAAADSLAIPGEDKAMHCHTRSWWMSVFGISLHCTFGILYLRTKCV